jgi:hypothetical protein
MGGGKSRGGKFGDSFLILSEEMLDLSTYYTI